MKRQTGLLTICVCLLAISSMLPAARGQRTAVDGEVRKYVAEPPVGIYFDFHGGTSGRPAKFLDHPHVDGVFLRTSWKQVEAQRGVYDFGQLANTTKPWVEAGKGVIIGIALAGQHNRSTPEWVYEVVPPISYERKGIKVEVPRCWDPKFLPLVGGMVEAFGEQYNGNPNINAILVGPAHIGFLTAMPNRVGAEQFMEAGWTPDNYKTYATGLCALYAQHFPNSRLWMRCAGMLIGIREPADYGFDNEPYFTDTRNEILEHAARTYGCTIGFNALEADSKAYMATKAPQFLARMSDGVVAGKYGLEVSDDWPMWLPLNRRRQSSPPANRLEDSSAETMNAYFEACMRNAIGGFRGVPESHITLMKLLETDLSASYPGYEEYQQQVYEITGWVREQMKKNATALYQK